MVPGSSPGGPTNPGREMEQIITGLVRVMKEASQANVRVEKKREDFSNLSATKNSTETSIEKINKELKDGEKELKKAKKQADAVGLDIRAIYEKETSIRNRAELASNQKEYEAASREINSVSKEKSNKLRLLETLNHKFAQVSETWKEKQAKLKKTLSNLKEQLGKLEEDGSRIKEEITGLLEARNTIVNKVPTEYRPRYERMLSNVPNPVVPIIRQVCSACYYKVVPKDMHNLRCGDVLVCRNCYRFLYFDKEEQKENLRASF